MARSSHCRACNAEIVWVKHIDTGNLAPIDIKPANDGPLTIIALGHHSGPVSRYRVLSRQEKAAAAAGELVIEARYTNHFQTCPSAERFRA